jgi:hypothetical protein
MAQYITGSKLPAIQDLYTRWCQRKALKIVKDSSHPSHRLFFLLPHSTQYWSAKSRNKRLLNSFYPQVTRLLNSFYPQVIRLLNSFYPQVIRLLNSFYPQVIRLLNSFYSQVIRLLNI